MATALRELGTRGVKTSQKQAIPGRTDMVKNNAGGYTFQVSDMSRIRRFLILGTEGGSYYQSEMDLTRGNSETLFNFVQSASPEEQLSLIKEMIQISEQGRAVKANYVLFMLAMLMGESPYSAVRRYAGDILPRIARIPTHLAIFINYVLQFRGWGRILKRSVANWYLKKPTDTLAYQAIKYRNREGWTHRDILRLAKPVPPNDHTSELFAFMSGKEFSSRLLQDIPLLSGYLESQKLNDVELNNSTEQKICELIKEYGLTREMIPNQFLKSSLVWEALLEKMPFTAMVRNLANMSRVGLLVPGNYEVIEQIRDTLISQEQITRSRIHPLNIMNASFKYAEGDGYTPVGQIVDALDTAFHLAFQNVEDLGQRITVAVDASGSMTWGNPLSSAQVAGAIALVVARTQKRHTLMSFDHKIGEVTLTAKDTINSAGDKLNQRGGGTDCSLPFRAAWQNNIPTDLFVIITDNETWYGDQHPVQALESYRKETGINAKLLVLSVTATQSSICDSRDPLQLDIAGFDSAFPKIMEEFARL